MSKKIRDLTGLQFERLTVIKRTERPINAKSKNIYWLCKCNCSEGKIIIVPGNKLTMGHTRSCGCYQKDMASKTNKTHGETKTHLYSIWQAMKRRCYYSKDLRYHVYGAKGIEVCDEWLHSFESFKQWALDNGYKENLSIDRKSVNGNYNPDNCRWVDMKKQQNNRTNNRLLEFNGKIHTLAEWAEITGISIKVLHARVTKLNWSVDRAFTEPLRTTKKQRLNK